MRTEHLGELYEKARLAIDDLERHGKDGVQVLGLEFGEMSDGSGRTFASVDFTDENGNEEWVRFIAPAAEDAPKWAPRDWQTTGSMDDHHPSEWERIVTQPTRREQAAFRRWARSTS